MGDKKYTYCARKARIDVYCQKLDAVIWTQTPSEAAYALILDNDPKVKAFASQPGQYKFHGKSFQPDFLVEYTDGSFAFIEIHTRKYKSQKYEERIALFTKVFKEKLGADLKFIYNDEIDLQYVRNIEHLSQYARMTSDHIERVVHQAWFLPKTISLGDAEQYLKEKLGAGFSIKVLMWLRLYNFDWQKKISKNTLLERAEA